MVPAGLPAALAVMGGERDGLLTATGVHLYASRDIPERNATYEVARYAPGFLLVGDDSGGLGFLVRADDPASPVFSSDLGDLDPAGFLPVAADLSSWAGALDSARTE